MKRRNWPLITDVPAGTASCCCCAPVDNHLLPCAHAVLCCRQLLHLRCSQSHGLQRAREGAAQPQRAAKVAVLLEHVRHTLTRSNSLGGGAE